MREEYLKIRPKFKQGYIPTEFIKRWCKQEGKDFNVIQQVLDYITNIPPFFNGDVQGETLSRMINHFDIFYKAQILYNKQNKEVLCR